MFHRNRSRLAATMIAVMAVLSGTAAANASTLAPALVAQPAVIGGHDAMDGAWPAVVSVGSAGRSALRGSFCGGTLVAPTWVVTAAHCVEGEVSRDLVVHVGLTVLSAPGGVTVGIRQIVRAQWIKRLDRNDIALLELTAPVAQTPMAVATSQSVYAAGTMATILGWGSSRPSNRGFRDHLQEGVVTTERGPLCRWTWGRIDTQLVVCAGTPRRGIPVDSCSGDSGGPLVIRDALGNPLLAGVVSFGGYRCGVPRQPTVYTKTVAYLAWIRQVTGVS